MKKFLLAAVLSAGAVCLYVGQASAGLFKCCCCKKCCTFCVKPYNAFSPVCCGNLCFDGCCPMPSQPCCNPCGNNACCNACPAPGPCCGDGSCDSGGPSFLPGSTVAPPQLPAGGGPSFTAPQPQPLPGGAGARGSYLPRPYAPPVQPVGYRQPYPYAYPYGYAAPAAAPPGYQPYQPMAVPSYWYQQ